MQPWPEIRNELSLELNPEGHAFCTFCGTLFKYIAKQLFFGEKKTIYIYIFNTALNNTYFKRNIWSPGRGSELV